MTTRLAQAHRAAQAQLAEALARAVLIQWRATVQGPGVGTDLFIQRAVPLVKAQARSSSALARTYYSNARSLELPGERRVSIDIDELADEQVVAGLVAAGFQQLSDSLEAGHDLSESLRIAGNSAAGSAMRNSMAPGRRGIKDSADSRVLGFYRVTAGDGRSCHFCEALASRGAVYRGSSFDKSDPRFYGDGEVKVHDRCRCSFAPFFRDEPDLPDSVQERYDQWRTATSPFTGHSKLTAWRRYWEALNRGESNDDALARAYKVSISGSISAEEVA